MPSCGHGSGVAGEKCRAAERFSGRRGRGGPEAGSDRQRPAEPAVLGAPDLPADGTAEQIGQLREERGRTGSKALPASVILIGLANRVVPAEGDLVDVALQERVAELVEDADLRGCEFLPVAVSTEI